MTESPSHSGRHELQHLDVSLRSQTNSADVLQLGDGILWNWCSDLGEPSDVDSR